MESERRLFLPGPGCPNDDICYYLRECVDAKKIRTEMVKAKAGEDNMLEFSVQVSVCRSEDAQDAKRRSNDIIWKPRA